MRILKNTWFTRFAGKEGITDTELKEAVNRLEAGQAEADLGGGVYKMRVARQGEGKAGSYRVIVLFKSEERTFFVYGFAKSVMANISDKQLRNFKKTAKVVLGLTDKQLDDIIKKGAYLEIRRS